jgi:hypothetical protein
MKVRIPSPAMIVAALALILALSGTAVASGLITGAQIKNNTVSSVDLTNNSIQSVDVKNGSLKAVDFAPGVLTPGVPGAPGPAGPQGAPGLADVEIVMVDGVNDSASSKQTEATCPAGKQLIGGGAHIVNAGSDVALDESYPASATKWRATAYEIIATAVNWHLQAYAICATVATP